MCQKKGGYTPGNMVIHVTFFLACFQTFINKRYIVGQHQTGQCDVYLPQSLYDCAPEINLLHNQLIFAREKKHE